MKDSSLSPPPGWEHIKLQRFVGNGINIRYAVAHPTGTPKGMVLLVHGWPESWYSYRHQLLALSQQGYLAVAPDMRGYGGTDQPQDVQEYNIYRLAGDALSLVSHMGYMKCLLVGHDWGAMIGFWLTLLHPDIFVAYAALSIPYVRPDGNAPPLEMMMNMFGDPNGPDARDEAIYFYQLHHQMPQAAKQYEDNLYETLWRAYGNTPGNPVDESDAIDPMGKLYVEGEPVGLWKRMPRPYTLPKWLDQASFDYYLKQFRTAGVLGGLSYYRVMDINHHATQTI